VNEPLIRPDHLRPEGEVGVAAWLLRRRAAVAAGVLGVVAFCVVAIVQPELWATPDWRVSVPGFAITAVASIVSLVRREPGGYWIWAIGLALAAAGQYDESIATFERAIELGWDVVPDARCEIARVLLEADRHDQADELWQELWAANPEEQWTLNAGGLSYHEAGRNEEAIKWLGEGLRLALAVDDPLQIVDQMSDARRLSLKRLGRREEAATHLRLAVALSPGTTLYRDALDRLG